MNTLVNNGAQLVHYVHDTYHVPQNVFLVITTSFLNYKYVLWNVTSTVMRLLKRTSERTV